MAMSLGGRGGAGAAVAVTTTQHFLSARKTHMSSSRGSRRRLKARPLLLQPFPPHGEDEVTTTITATPTTITTIM